MAKDLFHQSVKTALIKDGWTITHDPLYLNIAEIEIVRVSYKFKH